MAEENNIKIAVVDDHHLFRDGLKRLVESLGEKYVVNISAGNGKEFLAQLDTGNLPDIVLLDINMPEMNGLDMVRAIKNQGKYLGPIMMLTTEGDLSVIEKGRALGVSCWLVTPFEPVVLLSAIDKLLTPKEA